MIVQQPCPHCGKPLSPYWRDKCLHCGAPLFAGAPVVAPPVQVPVAAALAQVPIRVQSVLRGPTQEACLQQAAADAQQAAARGYTPIWQAWGQEGGLLTLTVIYELAGATGAMPAPAYAAVPGPQFAPVPQAWTQVQAPAVPPPGPPQAWTQAPPPTTGPAQAWTQAPAVPSPGPPQAPVQAWTQAPPPTTGPAPAGPAPGRTFSNRVVGAIASIIVFIVVFLVYSALNRALY